MAVRKRKAEPSQQSSATDEGQPREKSNIGLRPKKKGRWWHCGPIKFFALVFLAMFLLNYASLKQEYKYLMPTGIQHGYVYSGRGSIWNAGECCACNYYTEGGCATRQEF